MFLIRRLLVPLVVLVALLVGLDRLSLHFAEQDVAKRLQADAHTSTRPGVAIHGFPFLTQLISGTFGSVDINMHGVDAGPVEVSRLTVHIHDAHVSIGDVLSQSSSKIHVKHATAQLFLTYDELKAAVGRQVGANSVKFDHSVVTSASVSGGDTVVLHTAAGAVPIRLTGLPFGIRLTGAKATDAGLVVDGEASGLVVQS